MERGPRQAATRRSFALCAAVFACAFARSLRAEERDAASPRPPPVERTTPDVRVDAIRPEELPEDPTAFTTVLRVEEFEGEYQRVEDLLELVPGVQVRRFGGPGNPAEVSIRGSTASQVAILLDGVRLNTASSGSVDLSTIPASLIEQIEVSRGGGSVQTGSDAVGGIVNIVTIQPRAERETVLAGGGGSFDTWFASGTNTGALGGLETAAGYDFYKTLGDWEFQPVKRVVDGVSRPSLGSDIERVNNRTENHSALVSLGRDIGERMRFTFTDSFFYGSAGRPGLDSGGGANLGQSTTAHQRRTRNLASAKLEAAQVTPLGLDGELRAFHRFDRSRFRDPTPPFGPAIDADDRNQALGGRARVRRVVPLGFTEHDASLGLELRHDHYDPKDDSTRTRWTVGVFLQNDVSLWEGRARLVPALRIDETEDFDTEVLPRVGAILRPLPWLQIKGNAERSYRVPNFDELFFDEGSIKGNPNLDPEKAWNFDVGFELGLERAGPVSDLGFEFAAFRNEIDESIVYTLVSPFLVTAINTGEATAQGLELAGRLRLFDWVGFRATWTLLDTEVDATGRDLPGRADGEDTQRLSIGPPSGLFQLVGERRHTGDIFVGAGRTIRSRTVYDASLRVDLTQLPYWPEATRARKVLFSVIGTNLDDRSVRDAVFFPQPGRWLTFRVEAVW